MLTFFGLTPQYRKNIFNQIHDLVYHGGGGFIHSEIYNMPIWLRKYTFSLIQDHYKQEAKAIEEAKSGKNQKTLIDSDGKISTPDFKNKTSYK